MRALQAQEHFAGRFAKAVDEHTRAELYLWMCNRWLVIRLQCLSATIAVAIGAYVLFFNQTTSTTSSSSSSSSSSGNGSDAYGGSYDDDDGGGGGGAGAGTASRRS